MAARPLRLKFEGALCHVTARGNAQGPIYDDDGDRRRLTDLLWRTVERRGWLCPDSSPLSDHHMGGLDWLLR